MSFKKYKINKSLRVNIIYVLLYLLLGGIAGTLCSLYTAASLNNSSAEPAYIPYFSPKGGCTAAIVKEIEAAEKQIYMQAYSFTSKAIGDALCAAEKRGVKLCILVDQEQYAQKRAAQIDRLNGSNTFRYISKKSGLAHIKTLVVDNKSFLVGSFNMDENAEHINRENLLYVHGDSEACQQVIDNCIQNCQKALSYDKYQKKRKTLSKNLRKGAKRSNPNLH
ncbi:MAG: phospholipase D-like domain-containing protein [Bacteroidota bacterium]